MGNKAAAVEVYLRKHRNLWSPRVRMLKGERYLEEQVDEKQ